MTDLAKLAGEDPILASATPTEGIGLCLSGGGYRAMLFHVGALWRLMEADKLLSLTRVSSVSGGSITAGVLALAWEELARGGGMAAFQSKVVKPLRDLADTTIDERSVISGMLFPGMIGSHVARAYAKTLFGDATLQDLPETPRFVFNATNLETGTLFRFSRKEVRDWRVGRINAPRIRIADAVAASSAFPPVLSPFILDVTPGDFDPPLPGELVEDRFRTEISLSDGGVYDNLGLEQVWKSCKIVLVSDGGGRLADDSSPPGDWARQSMRVMEVIDHQVRNLRKRQVVGSFVAGERQGAYWGIRTNIADYGLGGEAVNASFDETLKIAEIPTRLKRMDGVQQERLINWGYAVSDAAIRRHWGVTAQRPGGLPYPGRGPGG